MNLSNSSDLSAVKNKEEVGIIKVFSSRLIQKSVTFLCYGLFISVYACYALVI